MDKVENEFSSNEKKMFECLGWGYLFHTTISISGLYNIAVEKAFAEEPEDSRAVGALRRAIKHIRSGKYRATEEFENLIKF